MAADEPSQKRASGTDDNPAPAPCPQTSDLGPLTSDFPLSPDEDLTVLFDRLAFAQARRGWRFGIDAVLLARHVAAGPCGDTLEVGTGCGVVAILLADGGFAGPIVTVESQPALADRARRSAGAGLAEPAPVGAAQQLLRQACGLRLPRLRLRRSGERVCAARTPGHAPHHRRRVGDHRRRDE